MHEHGWVERARAPRVNRYGWPTDPCVGDAAAARYVGAKSPNEHPPMPSAPPLQRRAERCAEQLRKRPDHHLDPLWIAYLRTMSGAQIRQEILNTRYHRLCLAGLSHRPNNVRLPVAPVCYHRWDLVGCAVAHPGEDWQQSLRSGKFPPS